MTPRAPPADVIDEVVPETDEDDMPTEDEPVLTQLVEYPPSPIGDTVIPLTDDDEEEEEEAGRPTEEQPKKRQRTEADSPVAVVSE